MNDAGLAAAELAPVHGPNPASLLPVTAAASGPSQTALVARVCVAGPSQSARAARAALANGLGLTSATRVQRVGAAGAMPTRSGVERVRPMHVPRGPMGSAKAA